MFLLCIDVILESLDTHISFEMSIKVKKSLKGHSGFQKSWDRIQWHEGKKIIK